MNTALIEDETRSREIMARIPAKRWGSPEDFKGPVVFLASEASNYVSGEVLVVDGGWMGKDTYLWFCYYRLLVIYAFLKFDRSLMLSGSSY